MEPYFQEKLTERNHALDGHFSKKTLQFKRKPSKDDDDSDCDWDDECLDSELDEDGLVNVERTGVFCNDLSEFTEFLVRVRKLNIEDTMIKIGIDDGQSLLKVCMSLQSLSSIASEDQKKRSKYSEVSIFKGLMTVKPSAPKRAT